MKKRIILLLMAVICCVQMRASTSFWSDDIQYSTTSDSTVEVSDCYTNIEGSLKLSSYVRNGGVLYRVTSIGYQAFYVCHGLTSVVIPEGVTSIGYQAFYGCSGLTSVVIPEGCTIIGISAFEGCSRLRSVTIPEGCTSIGGFAFSRCSGLTSVVISQGCTSIGDAAFQGCSGLTSVVIPESVTSIGNNAFFGCSGLTSVVVDANNTTYNSRNNCNAIIVTATNALICGCNNTVIPDCVTSIGGSAFWGCSGLTSVVIPAGVTSIGEWAFRGCSGLTSVVVDANNTTYDSRNNCNAIIETATNALICGSNNTVIPDGVTSIGEWAFENCTGLKSVTIPESVTSIDEGAFRGCNCTISLFAISQETFNFSEWNFNGDLYIKIPSGTTAIAPNAFAYCSRISGIDIPSSITSIGERAFYGCTRLKTMNIPASVTDIYYGAFSGCSGLTSISVDKNNTVYDSRKDCNAIILTADNMLVFGCKNSTIPEGVTSIFSSAFRGTGLSSLTIPKSVSDVDYDAFAETNLSMLKIEGLALNSYNFLNYCGTGCTVYVKLLLDGMTNYDCKIVPEFTPQLTASPTGCAVRGENIPVALSCNLSDVPFTLSPAAPSAFVGGLRPSTTQYLTYSFTTEDGRTGTYTGSAYPVELPDLELTTLNPMVTSLGCAIVAANTNISDREMNVGFQWRKQTAPDDVPSKEAYAAIYDGRLEGYIKNLQTGNDVYYRVRPFYKATDGTYYYGEWIGFDPSDFTYFEPTVHTYPVENLTDETASVRGYVLPGTDEVKTQGFEYWPTNGTAPAPRRVYAKAPATDVSVVFAKGQVMTATLTGLRPLTDYTYRAFVETATGQTTYGEEQTFTTPVPTGIVTIDAAEPEPETVGYYDLSGRRIAEPLRHGITIIRYADGTSRKVMKK